MQVETPSPSVDMVVDVIQDRKHSYERYDCELNYEFLDLYYYFVLLFC